MAQLTGICLLTSDVERLAGFYATVLGGDVVGDAVFATVSAAGAELSFFTVSGMEQQAPGSMRGAGTGAFTLEIRVDDVDEVAERLGSLDVEVVKPPTTQPWGRRSVWLRDPDGGIANCYREVPARADPETAVRTYFRRLLVEKDLSVCEELLAADYVDHDAPDGSPPGPAATRTYVEHLLREHPGLTFELDDLVADDRTVALRATWRAPDLHQRGLVFIRVDDAGRLAERWSAYVP